MKKSDIIAAIENRVRTAKTEKYSLWTIGVTDNPSTRKSQHDNPKYWMQWNADSEQDAREIEAYFVKKGMKGGTGGKGGADYVYIF